MTIAKLELNSRSPFLIIACVLAFAIATANLYASAILAVSLVLIEPIRSRQMLSSLAPSALALALFAIAILIFVVSKAGTMSVLEDLIRFPFPYFIYFWEYSPVVTALFWIGCLLSAFDSDRMVVILLTVGDGRLVDGGGGDDRGGLGAVRDARGKHGRIESDAASSGFDIPFTFGRFRRAI